MSYKFLVWTQRKIGKVFAVVETFKSCPVCTLLLKHFSKFATISVHITRCDKMHVD